MKTSTVFSLLAMTFGAISQAQAAALATNDNFANAFLYTGMSQSASSAAATAEPGEPTGLGVGGNLPSHTLWWKYIPQFTGLYQIDTVTTPFDTVLSVYSGTKVSALTRLAFDDDGGGATTSLVTVFLTKGVTYHFQVDGYHSTDFGMVTCHVGLTRYHTALTYLGIFVGDYSNLNSGGTFSFSVNTLGVVTGKLQFGVKTYPFTAAMDSAGAFAASVARPGFVPISISCTPSTTSFFLSDSVLANASSGPCSCTIKMGGTTITTNAYPMAPGDPGLAGKYPTSAPYSAAHPCERAGRYPMTVSPSGTSGWAVAAVTVSSLGKCTGAGNLGDGTAFTFSSPLLDNKGSGIFGIGTGGVFAFNVPLYASTGRLTVFGTLDATVTPVSLSGIAAWLRPSPKPGTVAYPAGIGTAPVLYGSLYKAPSASTRVDAAFDPAGACTFKASSAAYPLVVESMTLSPTNTLSYSAPNANLVSLKVNATYGTLTGSVRFTGASAASAVNAVLIHHPSLSPHGFYGYVQGAAYYEPATVTP